MTFSDGKAASPHEDASAPKSDLTQDFVPWFSLHGPSDFIALKLQIFRSIQDPTSPFYDPKNRKNIEFLIDYYKNTSELPTAEQPLRVHDGKLVSKEESEKLRANGEAVFEEVVRVLKFYRRVDVLLTFLSRGCSDRRLLV